MHRRGRAAATLPLASILSVCRGDARGACARRMLLRRLVPRRSGWLATTIRRAARSICASRQPGLPRPDATTSWCLSHRYRHRGLRAHLAERIDANGHRNWLLFSSATPTRFHLPRICCVAADVTLGRWPRLLLRHEGGHLALPMPSQAAAPPAPRFLQDALRAGAPACASGRRLRHILYRQPPWHAPGATPAARHRGTDRVDIFLRRRYRATCTEQPDDCRSAVRAHQQRSPAPSTRPAGACRPREQRAVHLHSEGLAPSTVALPGHDMQRPGAAGIDEQQHRSHQRPVPQPRPHPRPLPHEVEHFDTASLQPRIHRHVAAKALAPVRRCQQAFMAIAEIQPQAFARQEHLLALHARERRIRAVGFDLGDREPPVPAINARQRPGVDLARPAKAVAPAQAPVFVRWKMSREGCGAVHGGSVAPHASRAIRA